MAAIPARLRSVLVDQVGAIVLIVFALYVWAAPSVIVDGDNAEFTTLGTVGGIAHPSGYPLYLLWLRAMTWLPGTPAHAAAIATAILGAATMFVLHAACRAWGAKAWAASVTIAMYGAAPVVLRYNTEAEVFALNNLVVATVLWLAAQRGPVRGMARVALLALVAGAGLSNHATCVLAAPIGILGVVRGVRESSHRIAAVGAGIAALAIGFTPYAYLLVTTETSISWTPLHDLDGLLGHFLRRDYGGPGAFSPHGGDLHVVANFVALAATLARVWLWLPGLGGVALLVYRIARPGETETRWAWLLLAATFVLVGPALVARFDIEPTSIGLYVVRRFHLLAALLLAIPVAAALDVARKRVTVKLRPAIPIALATAAFAADLATSLVVVVPSRSPAFENAVRDLLRSMPPNAVIIASGDYFYFGTGYEQLCFDERPDVIAILWHHVDAPWYRDRLARRGLIVDTHAGGIPSLVIADQILASGRPLFVDITLGNIIAQRPTYPYGIVFRVLPRDTQRPSIDEVLEINKKLFATFELDYPTPSDPVELGAAIHHMYGETWRVIGEALARSGKQDDAAFAYALARQLEPKP